jgi:hypothetical protein
MATQDHTAGGDEVTPARRTLTKSGCVLSSEYIRFSRWFPSYMAFICLTMDASMPPYFAFHI